MDKIKELWQRFMKQAFSDYREFGDGTGEVEKEKIIIDRLSFPRLFSWDKSKYFSLVGICDIYDNTIIFHSRLQSELDLFALELVNYGIRIVDGICTDPSVYDESQEVGIVINPINTYNVYVGKNQGRAIFYFYVIGESMMEWIK